MSKKAKILILLAILLLASLAAAFCVEYFVLQVPVFDRSGWSNLDSGAVCYRDYYAKPITGWQEIDGNRYLFSSDGAMHTGWLEEGENRYYFANDGKLQTGYLEIDGNRYYLQDDGTPYTGWLENSDTKVYYDAQGVLQSGWLELPEGTYLLDEIGSPRTGWVEADGKRYYIEQNGLLNKSWQDTGDTLRYIVDGVPHTGWLNVPEGTFYFDSEGNQKTGWITDTKGRFYLYDDGTFATGFVTVGGIERYFTATGEYILLCNRWNYVPDDYEMNLVDYGNFKIDASCYDDFAAMVAAGKEAGINIKINNSYRSRQKQENMWETRRVKYMGQGMTLEEANAYIGRSVAVPGTSEHQTGLGIDITGGQKVYDWLAENSWKYGFILRYPDDKIDITGIIYEPWHFRYTGKAFAKDIYESGLCLEEYLESLKTE